MADAETRERCIAAGPTTCCSNRSKPRHWRRCCVNGWGWQWVRLMLERVSEECALNMAVVETKPDRYRPTRSMAGEHACCQPFGKAGSEVGDESDAA